MLRNLNPTAAPVVAISNFVVSLFSDGKVYRTINNYCSAISTQFTITDFLLVGRHPVICRLLRCARVPRPRLRATRTCGMLLLYLIYSGLFPDNESLSLRQLSAKLTTILCLSSFCKISNVLAFRCEHFLYRWCYLSHLPSHQDHVHIGFLPVFFSVRASPLRGLLPPYLLSRSALFGTPVFFNSYFRTSDLIALCPRLRWLSESIGTILQAGVDLLFGAHSVRGAGASMAFSLGATLLDILHSDDWS